MSIETCCRLLGDAHVHHINASMTNDIPDQPEAKFGASARLTIDLAALAANYRTLAARVAPARCGGVVKADGYGLGAVQVTRALIDAGCRDIFVAHLSEAAALHRYLPDDARLFLLNGLPPEAEQACLDAGTIPVLNTMAEARRWAAFARSRGTALDAALQFDSGMSRLGMSLDAARALAAEPALLDAVRPVLLMSHLACGDHHDAAANTRQRDAFETAAALFPGVARSLANSGGCYLPGAFHYDVARPGIALYGGTPSDASEVSLCPVVALEARVLQIRSVAAGTSVGYGLEHAAAAPSRWATIGIGYADGWPRSLGNVGSAWRDGVRLPIVGRVSMDSITIDISALAADTLDEGDWVELLGPDQSIDTVAKQAGTISYEILTGLGRRFDRRYVGGQGAAA